MDAAKILRLVGLLLAIVAAFVSIPYATEIMIVLGLAIGFVGVTEERRMLFMVLAITLNFVANALDPLPAIGVYLTAILGNVSTIVNAGAVAVIVMIVKDRLTE
jgi:hypothetical protein